MNSYNSNNIIDIILKWAILHDEWQNAIEFNQIWAESKN